MIRVEAVYVGNAEEAFVEDRLDEGINIIFSIDNHFGKTIVMQSIMYTMGSLPVFPNSFPFRSYVFVLDLNIDNRRVSLLRNKELFVIRDGDEISHFESVGEFQAYWSNTYHHLPSIVKNGQDTLVGLELYNQISFVPQDKRTSSRVNGSYFNKKDFVEMLYATVGLDARQMDTASVARLKARAQELRGRRKTLMKEARALKERGTGLAVVSPTADRDELKVTVEALNGIKNEIAALRKRRNRCLTLQKNDEAIRAELMGLNQTIKGGDIVCLDCGSQNIGYRVKGSDFVFDITTASMRTQIIRSLDERISAYSDEIAQINESLRAAQRKFDALVTDREFTLADMLAVQDDYASERDIDSELAAIDDELERIEETLKSNKQVEAAVKESRAAFKAKVLDKMNRAHERIDPDGKAEPYEDFFTSETRPYSGSETTEYYISRVYALAKLIDHGIPIVIDSFRAEELSTMREENVLALFSELSNQLILTATLKAEEGAGKYSGAEGVNGIDYSTMRKGHLLSASYLEAFLSKLAEFNIELLA